MADRLCEVQLKADLERRWKGPSKRMLPGSSRCAGSRSGRPQAAVAKRAPVTPKLPLAEATSPRARMGRGCARTTIWGGAPYRPRSARSTTGARLPSCVRAGSVEATTRSPFGFGKASHQAPRAPQTFRREVRLVSPAVVAEEPERKRGPKSKTRPRL